ncbi:MAG: hypothetical protein KDK99_10660 [Verrucomicrobiales bacterium]|nr:hypothetical protein [Verrucomicrobiales bacterium]
MKLTEEQIAQVERWAEEGANLNAIQNRLKEEFGINLTYLDARLLMTDLNVRMQDKKKQEEAEKAAAPADGEDLDAEVIDAEYDGEPPPRPVLDAETGEAAASTFTMEADTLTLPGALISGSATFSDGVQAKWMLDQMGRLSLKADQPGYQPPPADVPLFQQQLEKILVEKGLY